MSIIKSFKKIKIKKFKNPFFIAMVVSDKLMLVNDDKTKDDLVEAFGFIKDRDRLYETLISKELYARRRNNIHFLLHEMYHARCATLLGNFRYKLRYLKNIFKAYEEHPMEVVGLEIEKVNDPLITLSVIKVMGDRFTDVKYFDIAIEMALDGKYKSRFKIEDLQRDY